MKNIKIYRKLISYFISINPIGFLILVLVAITESIVSILTIISLAPLADFLSDPELKEVNKVTQYILSYLEKFNFEPSIVLFGFVFIFFNIVRSALDILLRFTSLKIKYNLIKITNLTLLTNLLFSRWSYFKAISEGKIINSLTRETNIVGDCMGVISTQIANTIKFVIIVFLPFILYPNFMFVLTVFLISLTIPFLLINKISYSLGKLTTNTSNDSIKKLTDIIRSVKTIKSFQKETYVKQIYKKILNEHFIAAVKSHTLTHGILSIYQTLGVAAIIFSLMIIDEILISEIALISWTMIQAIPLLSRLVSSNAALTNYFPSFEQVEEITIGANKNIEKSGGINIDHIKEIRLHNVDYKIKNKKIINKIDLHFKKGTVIALCGHSGSGKTTLAEMVMGFINPSNGDIYYNNNNVEKITIASIRQKISFCSQETILFSGTIMDNLSFVKPDLTEKEALIALKKADASEMVTNLSAGLYTDVGEFGSSLSGGERQKISLARAFLMNSDVYVFDEITASIDKLAENRIYKNIKKLGENAIVIIITHNINVLTIADVIHFVDKGRLLMSGTFYSLAKDCDPFKQYLASSKLDSN